MERYSSYSSHKVEQLYKANKATTNQQISLCSQGPGEQLATHPDEPLITQTLITNAPQFILVLKKVDRITKELLYITADISVGLC